MSVFAALFIVACTPSPRWYVQAGYKASCAPSGGEASVVLGPGRAPSLRAIARDLERSDGNDPARATIAPEVAAAIAPEVAAAIAPELAAAGPANPRNARQGADCDGRGPERLDAPPRDPLIDLAVTLDCTGAWRLPRIGRRRAGG